MLASLSLIDKFFLVSICEDTSFNETYIIETLRNVK